MTTDCKHYTLSFWYPMTNIYAKCPLCGKAIPEEHAIWLTHAAATRTPTAE